MALLDTASLIVTPNGYKASKLYSIVPSDGTGDMAFSRTGNTATRVNSSGLIEGVNANIPRLDYTDGTCPKLLLEPQRTNLLTYSNNFDNADWVKGAITVTSSSGSSPDGTNNAFLIDATNNNGNIKEIKTVTSSTAYVFSFYAKRGTATNHKYSIYNQTGASEIIAPTSYYSQTNSSTWVRIIIPFTTPVGCTSVAVYTHRDSLATGTTLIYGAQLEAGTFATSYIPTTTASVTRNGDISNNVNLQTNSILGTTANTYFFDYTCPTESRAAAFFTTLHLSSVASNSLAMSMGSSSYSIRVYNGGTLLLNYTFPTNPINIKCALVYSISAGTLKIFLNGSLINTVTGLSFANYSNLTLNDANSASISARYLLNKLAIWKTALSDSECVTLTT